MEGEIAEADKLVQRAATNGTMKGEFQGIPPTEKQVTMTLDQHRSSRSGQDRRTVERGGYVGSNATVRRCVTCP